jgi:hypothetical protein
MVSTTTSTTTSSSSSSSTTNTTRIELLEQRDCELQATALVLQPVLVAVVAVGAAVAVAATVVVVAGGAETYPHRMSERGAGAGQACTVHLLLACKCKHGDSFATCKHGYVYLCLFASFSSFIVTYHQHRHPRITIIIYQ